MSEWLEQAGRRFARLVTRAVVARPWLWRLFRRPLRAQFDWLAPVWDERRGPEALLPLQVAFDRLDGEPKRVLDLGTGTGKAARVAADRFPAAEVVGVDLSPAMIEEARRLLPINLAGRVGFEVADASSLPFEDGAFDLVVLLNMIPFFDELGFDQFEEIAAGEGTALLARRGTRS
jgi:malonyl-CoA O-methyltransferase